MTTKILSKKAREAREILKEYRKTVKNETKLADDIDEFAEHLDEVASKDGLGKVSKRRRRLGQRLSKTNFDDLISYLKNQTDDFEIFSEKWNHEIKGFSNLIAIQ